MKIRLIAPFSQGVRLALQSPTFSSPRIHLPQPSAFAAGVLITTSLCLSGCLHTPVPDLKPAVPEQWQHGIGYPVAATMPSPDLEHWWFVFHAPDLDAMVAQALRGNLDLAAAGERIHAARIVADHSQDSFLPEVHLRTDDIPSPNGTSSYFRAGGDVTWELGLFGKRQAAEQIAHSELSQLQDQAQMAKVTLVAEVVRDWIALRTAQAQLQLLTQAQATTAQQYHLQQSRVALGLDAPTSILPLDTQTHQQQALIGAKQLEIEQALEQLALLQGLVKPDPAWRATTTAPVLGTLPVVSVPADLIRIRPDIRQAEAEVWQATGELATARAERLPSVTLFASYMYSLQLIGRFSLHNISHNLTVNGVAVVGPSIDIPLFDWGRRKAAASAKGAALNAAVFSYRQTVLTAVHEVESALAAVSTGQARVTNQSAIVATAAQAMSKQQQMTQLGLSSNLDGLNQQQNQIQAQIDLIDAQQSEALAYVGLYKAFGGAPLTDTPVPAQPNVAAATHSSGTGG